MSKFNDRAEKVLVRAVALAEEFGHTYIGTEHLLLALSEDENSISGELLSKRGISFDLLKKQITDYSGVGAPCRLLTEDITPKAKRLLEASFLNAKRFSDGIVTTEHILLSLLEDKDSVAYKILKSVKCDILSIKDEIAVDLKNKKGIKEDDGTKALNQYGKNMVKLALEDRFDPVIGRDRETERLIRILTRKNKNNPCLIGEAGVGKTAIVEGLAKRIADGNVPDYLKNKIIYSIDLTHMVAGAKYRGDFEERIKNVLNEVVKNSNIILFIDEIHTIVGAGAAEGAIDASNILKPQLSRGEIQIIGSTTFKEYRRYIEKDPALERRFQSVIVEEPSHGATVEMLMGLKGRYEEHHGVSITDEAVLATVTLSERYINDRFLPDKAIDVLDEACAYKSFKKARKDCKTSFISRQKCISASDKSVDEILMDIKLHNELGAEVSQIRDTVTERDVELVIADICRIPVEQVRSSTDFNALKLGLLKDNVGQEAVVASVVSVLKRQELFGGNSTRPKGVFFASSKKKAELDSLLSSLALNYFGKESAIYRVDLNEYTERHSVSRLIGAPPGYEGYDEGGTLTERVRRFPYSLICFDEIDNACVEVRNIISRIVTTGRLNDSHSNEVSFNNSIIVITSKNESGKIIGFNNSKNEAKSASGMMRGIDAVLHFEAPSQSYIQSTAILRLKSFSENLQKIGVGLNINDDAYSFLFDYLKLNASSVTEIEDKINELIVNPVIELIYSTELTDVLVKADGNRLIISETVPEII